MATGVQTWSQTPANNATSDSNVNWAEGMAPSAVNDSARAVMASVAKWRDDNNGTLVTSGSSTAFTLVTNQVESALTAGYTVVAQFHVSNDAAATLAVDGLTAKPLQIYPGVNVSGYEMGGGSIHRFTYSTTGTGQWIRQSPPAHTVLTSTGGDLSATTTPTTVAFVSQGSSGVWLAIGSITIGGAGGVPICGMRLSDGTTLSPFMEFSQPSGNAGNGTVSFIYTNPGGNIRVQGANLSNTNGTLYGNIVAIRLA